MTSLTTNLGLQPTPSNGEFVIRIDACPTTAQPQRIRGDLSNDLANMSRRAASAASSTTQNTAGARFSLLPEHGPSLTVLTQRHHHLAISQGMERIQEMILEDPSAGKLVLDVDRIETQNPEKCFLYYSMGLNNYVSILFTSALFSSVLDESDKFAERPPFMRLPEPVGPKTAREFLHNNPPNGDPLYDHNPHVRKELVAVAPFLFSNPHDAGECPWIFYMLNSNIINRSPAEFFKMIFDRYDLASDPLKREAYISELAALHKGLRQCAYDYLSAMRSRDSRDIDHLEFETQDSLIREGARAVVFQFEVEEDLLPEVCYPSKEYGLPNEKLSSIPETVRAQCREVFPEDSTPEKNKELEGDRLSLQGRLLAQSTMVPDHNIKAHMHGYGRFFGIPGSDDILDPSETVSEAGKPEEWSLQECHRLARQANAAENTFECLELIARKEFLLARGKSIFKQIVSESLPQTREASHLKEGKRNHTEET